MRIALLLIIGSLLFCGCRVNPNAEREIALLRAEILDLEDQYYSLKSQRDTAVTQLSDCQGVSFNASQFPDPQSSGGCVNCENGAIIYESSPIIYENQGFGPTAIDHGSTPLDLNTSDQIRSFDNGSPVIDRNPPLEEIPPVEGSGSERSDGNTSVLNRSRGVAPDSIHTMRINPRLSKGEDLDGVAGHEGLSLLIQPINRMGGVIDETGQMTIQLLERDRLASQRQIGFWRFTPEEIQSFQVRKDLPDQGILLHLPFSQMLPTQNNVIVVTNFVTRSNNRHTARIQIPIEPPTKRYSLNQPLIANWIENDERWRNSSYPKGSDELEPGTEFDQPEFQNSSDVNELRYTEPENDRRTSVPRWRPVR